MAGTHIDTPEQAGQIRLRLEEVSLPEDVRFPGVYIEEVPSGVHAIAGVPISTTAFIGRTLRGPVDEAVRVSSFAEFQGIFGMLWSDSPLGFAVLHYFQNGGREAIIVRVAHNAQKAIIALPLVDGDHIELQAAGPGQWGANLQATIDHDTGDQSSFNLTVREVIGGAIAVEERFPAVSLHAGHARFVPTILASSRLVRVSTDLPRSKPQPTPLDAARTAVAIQAVIGPHADGDAIGYNQIASAAELQAAGRGLWALDTVAYVGLLYIPPLAPGVAVDPATLREALQYCQKRRAMLLLDPPHPDAGWQTAAQIEVDHRNGEGLFQLRDKNACMYYPWVMMANPLQPDLLQAFAPCGSVAGIIARADAQKGFWKAPAGLDAQILGAQSLAVELTDAGTRRLNTIGVNCLRTFAQAGSVVWGARTLAIEDQFESEWKYLPVRRLTLFIEASLYRGTKWAVFEPNDEPLWTQLRHSVTDFLHTLWRQGALQGNSPDQAYLVRCGNDTMTQSDMEQGVVNIMVGFAPLKPAEFVIIQIRQEAGQAVS